VTEWNQKSAEISGWTKAETLGKPLVGMFIAKESRADVRGHSSRLSLGRRRPTTTSRSWPRTAGSARSC
jgi:PAS domain S-box-containing protein